MMFKPPRINILALTEATFNVANLNGLGAILQSTSMGHPAGNCGFAVAVLVGVINKYRAIAAPDAPPPQSTTATNLLSIHHRKYFISYSYL